MSSASSARKTCSHRYVPPGPGGIFFGDKESGQDTFSFNVHPLFFYVQDALVQQVQGLFRDVYAPGRPELSSLDAKLTESPQISNENLDFPITPDTAFPELIPIRRASLCRHQICSALRYEGMRNQHSRAPVRGPFSRVGYL